MDFRCRFCGQDYLDEEDIVPHLMEKHTKEEIARELLRLGNMHWISPSESEGWH